MNEIDQHPREGRTTLTGGFHFVCDEGHTGGGRWLNVSRVGASVLLGRYLKPGREVIVRFASPLVSNDALEVKARVMWCRQIQGGPEFMAGIRIRRETPEMALDFATLGYAAREHRAVRPANKQESETVRPTAFARFCALGWKSKHSAGHKVAEAV